MKWLTRGGLVAALAVGGAVAAGTGWRGVTVLFAFFVLRRMSVPGGGAEATVEKPEINTRPALAPATE